MFISNVRRAFAGFAAAGVLVGAWQAHAAPSCGPFTLTASDGAADDQFGRAIAIDGDTLIVGARLDDGPAGADQGAAYIFRRTGSGWIEEAKLVAADGASADQFGGAVALDADTAIVGAALDDDLGTNSGSAYIFTRSGSTWTLQAKLTADDGAATDVFGGAVSLDADTAIVGASSDDDLGANSGSAYVFTRSGSTWTQQAKLTADDGAASDFFGAVALDADTALVGAPGDDDLGANSGAAYIFTRSGSIWTQQAKLTADDGAASDFFGAAVALDADTALVGAELDDDLGSASGAAYIFTRTGSTWTQQAKLTAEDGAASDLFGGAVALDADTALVGAPGDDDMGSASGAAYIFTRSGSAWTQQAKLTAADGAAGDEFGDAVAIDADTALVGAHLDDDLGTNSGSAQVFQRIGPVWIGPDQKILAADGAAFDDFGSSVALDGDTAILGALSDDDLASSSGAAYIFTRSGSIWTQQAKLTAADGAEFDNFGEAVALDADTALVGADLDDDLGSASGSAYIFTRSGSTWTQQAKLTANDGAGFDNFGAAVALDAGAALVGASGDDDLGESSGSAYVFTRSGSTWTQQAKLTADDGAVFDFFGEAVALDGDTALVGASGAAYVFTRSGSTWTQQAKLTADDGAEFDNFGAAVALDADTALAGAPGNADLGTNAGAAWLLTVAEECLPPFVHNTTAGAFSDSLADAINGAASAHVLSASPSAFFDIAPTDYLGKLLSISSRRGVRQPYLNTVTLADGASLSSAAGMPMTLFGQVDLPAGEGATLRAASLRLGAGAALNLFGASTLSAQTGPTTLEGAMTAFPGASASFSGPLAVEGELTFFTSTFSGPSLEIDHGGRFVGDGALSTSVVNRAGFLTIDDALITGDLTNEDSGAVTVQIGTLTMLGSLTNNGTIVGDLQTTRGAATQPGDGFSVGGAYAAGPNASLLMSSDLWRVAVGGDFDVAIDDNTRYDMAQAELRIGAALPTHLELMSTDIGASEDGLDRTLPGHYPVGALRLTGNTTTLVDAHDNDALGQAQCEALYVSALIIDAGATLNTNDCPVYYETLTNNGTVDDPSNLIQIVACVGDFTGDGQIDGADLGTLLGSWGQSGATDLNADGVTDGADLGTLLGSWGACP